MKEKLKLFIKENFIKEEKKLRLGNMRASVLEEAECLSIDDYINDNKDENKFQSLLFKYIDSKNLKDSDVYNKVNIDRRLFSKIRCNDNYKPSKDTIILLSLSLELTIEELNKLLNSSNYSLSNNNISDLIIKFCFLNNIYNINTINEYLYDYNCKTLN